MGEQEKMKTGKKCVSFSCFVAKTAHCSFVLIAEGVKRKKKPFPSSHSCAACFVEGWEESHQCEK